MSLNQPIINITKTESGTKEQVLEFESDNPNIAVPILTNIAIISMVLVLVSINVRKKTSKTIYELNLSKIFKNYKNLIIKTNELIEISNMKILDVNEFVDILDIEETLKLPILFYEKDKTEANFYIISYNIVYRYTMKNDKEEKNE
jgi:hypothetical protein